MKLSPNSADITAWIDRARARWGAEYGVDVPRELVRAIIVRESAVPGSKPLMVDTNATRTEPDGRKSYGLMQVLDSTAKELGALDPTSLLVGSVGVSYGTKYLAKQLHRYKGSVPDSVAAYNAGTARKDAQGRYVNSKGKPTVQKYVDYVLDWFQRFLSATGEAISKAASSPGGPVGLLFLALLGFLAMEKRRG